MPNISKKHFLGREVTILRSDSCCILPGTIGTVTGLMPGGFCVFFLSSKVHHPPRVDKNQSLEMFFETDAVELCVKEKQ